MKKMTAVLLLISLLLLGGCAGTPGETTAQSTEPTPVSATLKLYCFQAGKADAFLLWNEAGAVLIDTGESGFGKTILAKLEELGIERLDWLILTHFDKDHVGGAKKLLSELPVGCVLQSNCPKPGAEAYEKYCKALEERNISPVTLREPLSFQLGDAVFLVDPPARETYPEDPSNNSSLIVTVNHGEKRLVFLGDAESARLTEYLAQDPPPCDFLKVPYHGHWQPVLTELLEKLHPASAVITSSDEEPEDEETLALLRQQGTEILLTRNAPVQLTSDGRALTITQS